VKKLWMLLAAAALVGGGIFGYGKFYSQPQVSILETAVVRQGDIRGVLVETGIVKPQVGALVKIGSRITGTITQMKVKVGDWVKKNDLIALIDDREIRKSIDRQKAALQAAQNTLKQIQLTYPERIREAQANHDYAKKTLQREEELIKHEYTTGDALDRAGSQFQASEAVWKRLRDEFKTQRDITTANIQELTAQIQQLEINLSYTTIYSPIDGIISAVTTQEGETIVSGLQVANLVTVFDPTRLEMWIYVDETDIGKVKIGQKVEFYVDTFPERTFSGTIRSVYPEPVVKDNIVYYLAIVDIPPEDAVSLRPEMTTHVRIIFEERVGVLAVPNAAVKFVEGKQVAYQVMGPQKVEKRAIRLGIRGEEKTEILEGLKDGDTVATKIILPVGEKS